MRKPKAYLISIMKVLRYVMKILSKASIDVS